MGTVGEQLVRYKLLRWGYDAIIMEQGSKYDILVMKDQKPIRLQVKSAKSLYSQTRNDKFKLYNHYRFNTSFGRNGSLYTTNDVDLFAFVALDIEQILFTEVPTIKTTSIPLNKLSKSSGFNSWSELVERF
jgi:hypothetical protein